MLQAVAEILAKRDLSVQRKIWEKRYFIRQSWARMGLPRGWEVVGGNSERRDFTPQFGEVRIVCRNTLA